MGASQTVLCPSAQLATHVATPDLSVTFVGGFCDPDNLGWSETNLGWSAFLTQSPDGRLRLENVRYERGGHYVSVNIRDAPIMVPEFGELACPYVTYEQETLFFARFGSKTRTSTLRIKEEDYVGSINSIFLDAKREGWFIQTNYAILHVSAANVHEYTVVCGLPSHMEARDTFMKEADLFLGRYILASCYDHSGLYVYDIAMKEWTYPIYGVSVDHFRVWNDRYVCGAESKGFAFEKKAQQRVLWLVELVVVGNCVLEERPQRMKDTETTCGYKGVMIDDNNRVVVERTMWPLLGERLARLGEASVLPRGSLEVSVGRASPFLVVTRGVEGLSFRYNTPAKAASTDQSSLSFPPKTAQPQKK